MHIQGPAQIHRAQPLHGPHRAGEASSAPRLNLAGSEEANFAEHLEHVQQARELPEIRTDKVAALKAAIEAGEYETEAKLDVALERLLDELQAD